MESNDIMMSYFPSNPGNPFKLNFAFFIKLISGLMLKLYAELKSADSKFVFSNTALCKSQSENSAPLSSASVKSTSFSEHLLNFVF